MDKATAFFYAHAGYSWRADRETEAQGRERCAKALAAAERWALDEGYSFDWRVDQDVDSSSRSGERPAWQLWQCAMFDPEGVCVAGLGAVDFGRDGKPWGDNYRRVVQAELALEVMP